MSKADVFLHVVWTTFRRQPLVPTEWEQRLHRTIEARCAKWRCPSIAIGGTADHIHLVMRLHPTVTISRVIGEAKGLSSHLMTHGLQPDRFFGWQDGYWAVSLSPEDLSAVIAYVTNQREHHSTNNLLDHLEPIEAR
jgi:REP element-mobilizing transposase RayT